MTAGAAAGVSRISLGAAELPVWAHSVLEPKRSRLRFHRLISDARTADFHATVDGSGNDLVRPAVGDEEVKGMSFFVVLSDDPAVIAAAHAFMHPTMRHRGCCVRSLDAVPENTALLLDSVKVASDGGLPIIVHASLVPTATMYVGEFIVGLQRQSATVCRMEARAGVDDEAAFDDDAAFEGGDGGESWEGEHEDDGEGEDGDDGEDDGDSNSDSDGEGDGDSDGEGEGEGEDEDEDEDDGSRAESALGGASREHLHDRASSRAGGDIDRKLVGHLSRLDSAPSGGAPASAAPAGAASP